jgi:hypothetical protein
MHPLYVHYLHADFGKVNFKDLNNKTDNIYNIKLRLVRVTIVAVEKQIYSGCVSVALVIHHPMHMRRIILSSVASLTLP